MQKLTISVPGSPSKYEVVIGAALLSSFSKIIDLTKYSSVAIVFDEALERNWLPKLKSVLGSNIHTFPVASGEHSKDVDSLKLLWNGFAHARLDRHSLVINLGGGMVCDLGGFAASTYLRGIEFIHIPTTLLAQVDASIGGKTGINVAGAKNLAGSFAPPRGVIIDVQTLSTLPERERNSGFAEIIKHGLIADSSLLAALESIAVKSLSESELVDLVTRSCKVKHNIVETDFKESGQRQLLNFGHTLGHAIEAASHLTKSPLLHGEAISIGIIGEAYLSMKLGRINKSELEQIEALISRFDLPIRVPQTIALNEIKQLLSLDKKRTGTELHWVMLNGLGRADCNISISEELLIGALEYISAQ